MTRPAFHSDTSYRICNYLFSFTSYFNPFVFILAFECWRFPSFLPFLCFPSLLPLEALNHTCLSSLNHISLSGYSSAGSIYEQGSLVMSYRNTVWHTVWTIQALLHPWVPQKALRREAEQKRNALQPLSCMLFFFLSESKEDLERVEERFTNNNQAGKYSAI